MITDHEEVNLLLLSFDLDQFPKLYGVHLFLSLIKKDGESHTVLELRIGEFSCLLNKAVATSSSLGRRICAD